MKEQIEDGIPDMTGYKQPTKSEVDPLEKEEREAAKKTAKVAPKGAYVALTTIKCDGKEYHRGDEFDGKLYQDLIAVKAICKKEEWVNR